MIKKFSLKLLKYGILGIIATLIHMISAFALLHFYNVHLFIANLFGFLIAFLFSYTMQSLYVFGHRLHPKKALRYFLVQFSSLLIAYFFSLLFEALNPYIKTLIIVFILPLVTFLLHHFWTFNTQGIQHES